GLRAAIAVLGVVVDDPLAQRVARRRLVAGVDRGVDLQSGRIGVGLEDRLRQLAGELGHIGRDLAGVVAVAVARRRVPERRLEGRAVLLLGQEVVLAHAAQDVALA